ncbi:uncharacterized protein [Tenebrio molitor]|uniref:uncharacterized protein isoform X2 n=1 Tax=Tenebrio molitor TaxID=7067 RepID=UPI0036246E0C
MMDHDNNVKVSDGILLVRTNSGTSKIERVLVHTRAGKGKSFVKCRLQQFDRRKSTSKIPVLVRSRRKRVKKVKQFFVDKPPQQDGDFKIVRHCKDLDFSTRVSTGCLRQSKSEEAADFAHSENGEEEWYTSDRESGIDDCSVAATLLQNEDVEASQNEDVSEARSLQNEASDVMSSWSKISNWSMSETKIHKPTFTADSELTVFECDSYQVEENKDSTIHLRDPEDDDFELEDDDADFQKEMPGKRTGNLQRSFIVMSQYQSTLEGLQARRQQSDSEGNEDFEADNGSEGSYVYVERYIDSGLRPLKSDESRLYLDAINYRSKRRVHTSSESDEVQPLLDEIPSNIFQPWKKSKKKKKSETDDVVKKPSSVMSRGDFTSTEEETKSTASEPTDIDTGPLKKLQEFEDVTYTIKTDEPEEKPMEDFCVHTRDVPEGELADFSSTTFDEPARPREKKKKSIFRFLKKDDFCVHTHDAPESDSYSPDSRLSIITKKQEKPLLESPRSRKTAPEGRGVVDDEVQSSRITKKQEKPLLQSPRSRKTEKPLLESPRSRKTAPEGGGVVDDEVQSSRTPDASRLTLLTHKERRSKIFTQKSDEDDDLRSITAFRYPQYPSGTTLVDLKETSRESLRDFESEDPKSASTTTTTYSPKSSRMTLSSHKERRSRTSSTKSSHTPEASPFNAKERRWKRFADRSALVEEDKSQMKLVSNKEKRRSRMKGFSGTNDSTHTDSSSKSTSARRF